MMLKGQKDHGLWHMHFYEHALREVTDKAWQAIPFERKLNFISYLSNTQLHLLPLHLCKRYRCISVKTLQSQALELLVRHAVKCQKMLKLIINDIYFYKL